MATKPSTKKVMFKKDLSAKDSSENTLPAEPSGELVIKTLAMPANTNVSGDIFGGWIVSQMDIGGGILAKQRAKSRAATVSIDKMIFRRPVHVGDMVSCYGKVTRVGRTSMTIEMTAWTRTIEDEVLHLVTEGVFTFVALDNKGKPHPVDRD